MWTVPALVVVSAVGCSVPAGPSGVPPQVSTRAPTVTTSARAPGVAQSTGPERSFITATLRAGFAELSRTIDADVAIALSDGMSVGSLGTPPSGPAWSVIKVPLSIAALRDADAVGGMEATVAAAIESSDNASAEAMWSDLGSPASARRAVEQVLREGGDRRTRVQTSRVRAGFTAFGQTIWAMRDQARFAWALPCIDGAEPILAAMNAIVEAQRWGLAMLPDVPSKGGWGPSPNGDYLVRQMGVLTATGGRLGIAIAALPDDGSFASGVLALDSVAAWVSTNLTGIRGTRCESR